MPRRLFRFLISRLHRIEGQVRLVLSRILGLEGIDAPRNASVFRTSLGVGRLAALFRVICWAATLRYFDEGLVASLHSNNFMDGLGLTGSVGAEPPLFGSESVLRVLIPSLGNVFHPGAGLELLKFFSIPASLFALFYIVALGVHPSLRLPRSLIIAAMGYASFEFHQILSAMGGLETQLATLFLLMTVYYTVAWKPWSLGFSLGLGMLARPDSLLCFAAVLLIGLVRAPKTLPRVVVGALLVCLPWVIGATWYYGTPLPHAWDVVWRARECGFSAPSPGTISEWLAQSWNRSATGIHSLLGPTYGGADSGQFAFYTPFASSLVAHVMLCFAVLGGMTLLRRQHWASLPIAIFALVHWVYFLVLVPDQEVWHKMGFAVLLVVLAMRGVQLVTGWIGNSRLRKAARTGFCLAYVACFVSVLPVTIHVERQYQRGVVNPTRRAAGRYLAGHLAAGETVACTHPGYIAYYSRAKILDWPGRMSREVSSWAREQGGDSNTFEHLVQDLKPDYVFLSRSEADGFLASAWFRGAYQLEEVFEADREAAREVQRFEPKVETEYRLYRKRG